MALTSMVAGEIHEPLLSRAVVYRLHENLVGYYISKALNSLVIKFETQTSNKASTIS